jgi:hypothetical protein
MKKKTKQIAALLVILALSALSSQRTLAAASANLNQARNGTDASPTNPINWVNGNLGTSQAHYIEGMSSPYQCVMTGITIGVQVSIIIEYDIKNSSQNAFDYLTYYNRINPHAFFQHSNPETIDPLAGSGLSALTPSTTYPIPVPSSAGSPVAGQPAASYNSLSASDRLMTLFNGTIDTIYYVSQGSLSATQSQTQVMVKFTPISTTAVLAWGGHIASRNDWGYTGGSPRSAGGISGSPFHMRLISWNYGSIGSQDRSLSGGTVSAPPAPLPVELIHFSAHSENNANHLDWTTASEINNDYFIVQRASGNTNFESLAIVHGAGNTSTATDYAWVDSRPLSGLSYYRLIQTDYDGATNILGPVCVQSGSKHKALEEFKAYANATSQDFFISFYSPHKGTAKLDVLNAEGKLTHTETLVTDEGNNFIRIDDCRLAAKGMYFVRLTQDAIVSPVQKIVRN